MTMLAAPYASAAAQRTFVASYGNDANACSLTLPCRGFAAAVAQTISGGEVIVLDSAGYGPVTITKSVSIVAPGGVYAGISAASGAGVAITAAGISVTLRGLTINGTGGAYGIRMTNGSALTVEDCAVSSFLNDSDASAISIETGAAVKVSGTVVSDAFNGILIGFGATANITNSQVVKTVFEGIALGGGTSGTTNVHIDGTLLTGSSAGASYCIDNVASVGTSGNISATHVTVTGCQTGIFNRPPGSGTTTVSNSMISGNGRAFVQTDGTFYSLGNNHVSGNAQPNSGAITIIGGQ